VRLKTSNQGIVCFVLASVTFPDDYLHNTSLHLQLLILTHFVVCLIMLLRYMHIVLICFVYVVIIKKYFIYLLIVILSNLCPLYIYHHILYD